MSERHEILDPRSAAGPTNKYTYFLPSAERIEAIGEGDLVKIKVRAIPPSDKWDAERMWVRVRSTSQDWLEGTLESDPDDMPGVVRGAAFRFPRNYVMDVIFHDEKRETALPLDTRREFWERCVVDRLVLDGELPVHVIMREEPSLTEEGDQFPDSGWRIVGDMRTATEEQVSARETAYVALGVVLNQDDSWLALIDEPIGVAYEKDFDRGIFFRMPDD